MSAYAQVKQWRKNNPEKWLAMKRRNYKRGRIHTINIRRRWCSEEVDLILKSTLPDFRLARLITRSVQAIQVKRSKVLKDRS